MRLLALPRRHGAAEARAYVASSAVYVNRINIHLDLSKPANSRQNNANWTYGVAKSLKSLNALLYIIHVIRITPHLRDIVASWQAGGSAETPPVGGCGGGRVYIEKHIHGDPPPYPLVLLRILP